MFNEDDFNEDDFREDISHEDHKKLTKFLTDVTKGTTTKIPVDVISYIPRPSVKEVEHAVQVIHRYTTKDKDADLTYNQTMEFTDASVITHRANIHDAVDRGVRVLTEDHYNEFCEKILEQSFFSRLYKADIVDFIFDSDVDNPSHEIVLTETGKEAFAPLYIKEKGNRSRCTAYLEKIAGGKEQANKLVDSYIDEKKNLPLGNLLSELFSQTYKEQLRGDTKDGDEDK